jgi:hypothetical protein
MAIIYSGFDTVTGKFRYSDGANFSLSDQPPAQATYQAYATENQLNQSYADLLSTFKSYQDTVTPTAAPSAPVTSNTPVVTNTTSNPSPVTNSATNPSGDPGPNTQKFDDGTAIITYADGSKKTIANDGAITTTGATDGSTTSQSGAEQTAVLKTTLSNFQEERSVALTAATDAETATQKAQEKVDALASEGTPEEIAAAQSELDAANENLTTAQDNLSNANTNVDTVQTAVDTATNTGLDADGLPIVNEPAATDNSGSIDEGARYQDEINKTQAETATPVETNRSGVPFGATASQTPGAQAQWSGAKDLRVKLRVPNEYLVGPAAGPTNIIQKNGGILFPYTPQITLDNQASYNTQNPLHSNYPLYFYKNSSVGPINVTAKFTVQNEFEGAVLLGVIHLLRGLTKMKFGNDPDAGSPPPVCRFDAYGDFMLYNVPVSIASWRHDLPDNVDYIAVGRPGSPTTYGHSMVPALSTIQLTLNVMYSRREMLEFNVKDWRSGGLKYRGYL